MKKIFILFIVLILNCNVVFASDKTSKQSDSCIKIDVVGSTLKIKFIDFTWWKTATEEDFQADIAKGADVNARCNDGTTVLMNVIGMSDVFNETYTEMVADFPIISKEKFLELAKLLIDAGADINAKDKKGNTALSIATKNNNSEIIKMLIEAEASDVNKVEDVEKHKTTPSLKYMSDAKQEPLNKTTSNDKNVNENFLDYDWWKTATLEDVKTEIANGADVNLEVEDDETHIMPILGMAIAKFIMNPNDSNNDENYKIIELLIDAGADVNAKMKTVHVTLKEEIPLLIFALAGKNYKSIKVMEKLIDAGADINMQGGHILVKQSPLMITSEIEKTKFLIETGADVNAYSEGLWGITALMLAIRDQKAEIIKVLIDAGADVNAKCIARNINEDELIKNLYIPSKLVGLDKQKYLEEAKKFVEEFKKVSPNREFIGATPLIIAAENSNPEIIRMLIDAGADTSLKSADNKTALDIAKEKNGNPEVIEILEHHQEFDEMFAECYSTQNIGNYANKFCKCAIKSAINALGPADKEKAKDAFDDARAGTFKNLIQKGKSAAFNECY